eukprot:2898764-Pyramimonas_sp.AAC.2
MRESNPCRARRAGRLHRVPLTAWKLARPSESTWPALGYAICKGPRPESESQRSRRHHPTTSARRDHPPSSRLSPPISASFLLPPSNRLG